MIDDVETLDEAEIIRKLDELVTKVALGKASERDRIRLKELSDLRSKLLRIPPSDRSQDRHRRNG